MTLKEIFKTVEGIAVLVGFGLVILTGAKMFAYLGLGAYAVINLPNGIQKAKAIIEYIVAKIKSLINKK